MSRTFHHGERRIRAQGVRKDPPDLRRVARTLIALAQAQAEAEAQQAQSNHAKSKTTKKAVDITTPNKTVTNAKTESPKPPHQAGDAS